MEKKDFFISYNHQDEGWAEWIDWQLEEVGYEVLIQKWDMGPGSNFVKEMQRAAEVCHRTLIVLSPHFLAAEYTQPEWAQAFARDPTGEKRLLIPVRVAECELKGFFKPLVYIDFFPLVTEPPASEQDKSEVIRQLRQRLLEGVKLHRQKPNEAPPFPGFMEGLTRGKEKARHSRALQAYLDLVVEAVRDIDLFHLKHLVGGMQFPVDQVYTPLKVNPRELHTGATRLEAARDRSVRYLADAQKEPRELGGVLTSLFELPHYRCMLVLGKPGAGKTTLMKHLAYFYASGRQEKIASGLQARVPFFLRMKDIAVAIAGATRNRDGQGDPDLASVIHSSLQSRHPDQVPPLARLETWLHDKALVLLDGLDEVADQDQRKEVADWVKRAVRAYHEAYFIISSRVYGYDPYYTPDHAFTVEVDDLNATQRADLLHLWFGHVYRQRSLFSPTQTWQPEAVARRLVDTIEAYENAHLRDLACNPLLLSMIALVQLAQLDENRDIKAPLPASRHTLYAQGVALFITEWNWDFAREVAHRSLDETQYLELLEHSALLLQKTQGAKTDEIPQIDRDRLLSHLSQRLPGLDVETLERCLQHSHARTLLLVEQKLDNWGFQHKTFQEYLCAEAIAHDPGDELDTLVDHLGEDHWRVVFDLFVEGRTPADGQPSRILQDFLQRAGQRFGHDIALAGRGWYWLEELYLDNTFHYPAPEKNRLQHNAWQGLASAENSPVLAKFHNFAVRGLPAVQLNEPRFLQRLDELARKTASLVHHLLLLPELFSNPEAALIRRLGRYLDDAWPAPAKGAAALALKRFEYSDAERLNRHLFVPIAAGEFCRGSRSGEQEAGDNEIDGKKYRLGAFEIGLYPVTNAEYLQFVQKTGHPTPHFEWENNCYPVGQGNHPVVWVSWYNAQAYIDWLNEQKDGYHYFLPTEAQWERAARGPAVWQNKENRRRYPWGDDFNPEICNVYESDLRRTTPVGCFIDGASPEGALDMAGNVWEWCADWYDENYYKQKKVEENKKSTDYKALRGGAFGLYGVSARCAYRDNYRPDNDVGCGFRVARI
jgi:formylglycine-generating enzyme required for sulfatase activity/energy-coupling factor transporter ATP-binding protein EcfA2